MFEFDDIFTFNDDFYKANTFDREATYNGIVKFFVDNVWKFEANGEDESGQQFYLSTSKVSDVISNVIRPEHIINLGDGIEFRSRLNISPSKKNIIDEYDFIYDVFNRFVDTFNIVSMPNIHLGVNFNHARFKTYDFNAGPSTPKSKKILRLRILKTLRKIGYIQLNVSGQSCKGLDMNLELPNEIGKLDVYGVINKLHIHPSQKTAKNTYIKNFNCVNIQELNLSPRYALENGQCINQGICKKHNCRRPKQNFNDGNNIIIDEFTTLALPF